MNWLEHARREFQKSARQPTAITAERNLTAVKAVLHPVNWGKSKAAIDSNGSTTRASDVGTEIEDQGLALEASAISPSAAPDRLLQHQAGADAQLCPAAQGWGPEEWQVIFDERAAIAEFDGGLPRHQAEALAIAYCTAEWLNRNPVHSPPGRCLSCGGSEQPREPLLPCGTTESGHVWLHSRCWPAWYAERKAAVVAAIRGTGGLNFPDDFEKKGPR